MEYFKNKLLTLPMYPELSEESIKYICEQINKFYKLEDE
jgi:dTDP-4-amino-4,6-dideoxygalactose transaminase